MEPVLNMDHDPDGNSQQVAVIMTGQVYREAGLKQSKHPEVEGMLYDKLCQIGKHKLRDDVRKMAMSIAMMVSDKEFKPTVSWLDNFMRRFCLSRKKMGFHSSAMLKRKGNAQPQAQPPASASGLTQEDVFNVLGINMDGNGIEEGGKVTPTEKIIEDVIAETENGINGNQGIDSDNQTSLLDVVDKNCSIDDLFPSDSENIEGKPDSPEQTEEKEQPVCEEIEQLNKLENLTSQIVQSQEDEGEVENTSSRLDDESTNEDSDKKDEVSSKESRKRKGKSSLNEDTDQSEEEEVKKSVKLEEIASDDDQEGGGRKSKQAEDELKIKYTKEEQEYYKKNINDVQKKLNEGVMRCTACHEQINHQIRSLVHTHPVLGILTCKRCRKYYGRGQFCKDEEGYDEYCRLCAEGGDLLCCEQDGCYNGFCKRCIKRTMGRSEVKKAETTENWACYVCDKTSMMELRALHRAILSNLKESEIDNENLSRKELNKKNLLSKFEILKRNRKEKALKTSPAKPNKKASKGEDLVDSSNSEHKHHWLTENIDTMVDMLSLCLKNVEKINRIWKNSNYSTEGTEKAGNRIVKQLSGMVTNFEIIEKNVSVEVNKLRAEDNTENDKEAHTEGRNSKSDNSEVKVVPKKKNGNNATGKEQQPSTSKTKKTKAKEVDDDPSIEEAEGDSKKRIRNSLSEASVTEDMEIEFPSQDSSKAGIDSEGECSAAADDPMEQDMTSNGSGDENDMADESISGECSYNNEVNTNKKSTELEACDNTGDKDSEENDKENIKVKRGRKGRSKLSREGKDKGEENDELLEKDKEKESDQEAEENDSSLGNKKDVESDSEVAKGMGKTIKIKKEIESDEEVAKGMGKTTKIKREIESDEEVEGQEDEVALKKNAEESCDNDEEAETNEKKQSKEKSEQTKKLRSKNKDIKEEDSDTSKTKEMKKETPKKRGRKPKECDSSTEQRKSKAKSGNSAGGQQKEKKQPIKRRSKRKIIDDDEDDTLGIDDPSSNDDSSEEEDTDTEMRRRREEYGGRSEKKRKKKAVKKEIKTEELSTDDEKSDVEEKSSKRPTKSPVKKKPEKTAEKETSDEELENDESKKRNSKVSEKKTKDINTDSDNDNNELMFDNEAIESNEEDEKKKVKKAVKAGGSPVKNDNQKAMASLLESESDDELEDKPKPKCKKKNYLKKCAEKMKKVQHLTEEEKEELKDKHLKSKCQTEVEKISTEAKDKLDKDGFIDIKEFPEFRRKKVISQQKEVKTYEGEADEEDSDEEFEKLMKFNVNKKFNKPGPKSKKKYQDPDSEKEEEIEKEIKKEDESENEDKKMVKKEIAPKKKKEGLLDIDIDNEEEEEEEEQEEEDKKKSEKKGGINLNEKMKKQILLSSDEEEEDEDSEEKENQEDDERRRKKYEEKKKKKKEEEEKEKENDNDEDEDAAIKDEEEESDGGKAKKVHKKGYMNLNLSSDDGEIGEDDEEHEQDSQDEEDEEDDEEEDEDDSDFEESPRKRRTFQLSSSDSEEDKDKRKSKRKKKESSSENDSEDLDETPKSKRKRIRKMSSSSNDGDEEGNKEDSPSKHRKIRRVIRDEDLMETTKNATQEEEERKKRIVERQKQYNEIFEIDVEADQKDLGKLILDFNPETKKELVSVNEKLVKFLKPHQVKGIKFMWEATCESIEMLESRSGSGCILAHCMGLGKTLQVITFTHTLLSNKKTNRNIQRIMVCCPVNTVYNWVNEYSSWLKGKLLHFEVAELVSAKDLWSRAYRLDDWWKEGGICIMGYDMYRNLSNCKSKRYKGKMKEIFQKTLVDPGPDLIVCDEGHILKNEKTALSVAINKIKTQRRIVLTGTPLQNNLKEYHCMIQFVKPNLLGTKKEFMNRFVNPIEQGQCADAMPRDVRRMKRRAHILHNLLEGCVQRFDYTVLQPFLPPKFEYVISVQLSDLQVKLYQYYLDNLAQGGPKRQGSGLFVDFGALSRVWTHPRVLELAVRRAIYQDDDDDLADFICDDSTEAESSEDEGRKKKTKKKKNKEEDEDEIEEEEVDEEEGEKPGPIPGLTDSGKVRVDWWKKVVSDYYENGEDDDFMDDLDHGGKLILLLDILRECCSIGDKVLVFSQSLLALDMIEDFLEMIDKGELEMPSMEDPLPLPFKHWKRDRDYLRLDGSTSPDARKNLCKTFNSTSNERCRLFLISTRAGGLGINLVAANRVVIFDSSWNPSHDTQSIFRVYRFGQKKPCYIYRFVAQGTMEEKIYSRQVTKMSTALRVVDEHQIKRYFKMEELAQLYEFTPSDKENRETPIVPKDRLLAELLKRQKDWIVNYHEHDSLLENQTSEELNEEERKAAWEDYENEKKGFMYQQRNSVMPVVGPSNMVASAAAPSLSLSSFSLEGVVNTIKAQNPNLTQNELCESVILATKQIQKIHLTHYQRVQGMVYNLKNPMIAPEQRKLLPFGNHPEMLPMLEQQLRMLEENIQRENQVINHMGQITSTRASANNTASMMSAGLIRGQPVSSGVNSATANYVTRPSATPSTSMMVQQQQLQQQQQHMQQQQVPQQQNPIEKKTTSNDVIMLD